MAKSLTSELHASVQGRAPSGTILSRLSILTLWCWRLRCRHELASLSEHQMRDAGLDRERVRRESSKPFWRA
jgi:uncharacterized protein YjiS (DUF1127 family)